MSRQNGRAPIQARPVQQAKQPAPAQGGPECIAVQEYIRRFVQKRLETLQAAQATYTEAVNLMLEQAAHDGGMTVAALEAGYLLTDLAAGFVRRPDGFPGEIVPLEERVGGLE